MVKSHQSQNKFDHLLAALNELEKRKGKLVRLAVMDGQRQIDEGVAIFSGVNIIVIANGLIS